MNSLVNTLHAPGRLTVLAALLAGLSASAMAVSPDLVISQVYAGGGNNLAVYNKDYIELFNRGVVPVTLNGWTLQYASASGTFNNTAALPTLTVQPGQYVLVEQQLGATGADLPSPFVSPLTTKLNMAVAGGKLALMRNSATFVLADLANPNLVDLVAWGSAAGVTSGVAPSMPNNVTALVRNSAGCADTDASNADFVRGAPTPRTSETARNLCGGGGPIDMPIVPVCPASLSAVQGEPARITLSVSDADSELTGATLAAAAGGISLGNFVAAADGKTGTIELATTAAMAGIYPATVTFSNSTGQSASCTVSVGVEGVARIFDIQGSGPASPLRGSVTVTEGIVTHVFPTGSYFIQDEEGDGNPETSDGLYIFTGSTPPAVPVAVGDLVRVKGLVTEFGTNGSVTELSNIAATTVLDKGRSIAPTNIEFVPGLNMEPYEGMLVNVTNALTVNATEYLGGRGELTLAVGRREKPTNLYRPGTPEATALAAANLANRLTLDDSLFTTPATIPYLGVDGTVRAGDTVSSLIGVIDYGSIGGGGLGFKVHPVSAPVFSRTNARTAAPLVPASSYRVASANVLNFFTTFTNGDDAFGATGQACTVGASTTRGNCRGADDMVEFVRQRDKIVSELLAIDADVVGLMEIQNNGDVAVDYLVRQLNAAAGFPTYAYVANAPATGTDAIRVAMIYKPARVKPSGAPMTDADPVNNRPTLAQTFKATNGARFSVVVNHFKSKAGCDSSGPNADQRDGQGCHNATRVLQASRLANVFIPQVIAASGDPDVLVIGDMNAYGAEDPINVLQQAGLVNEIERFVRGNGAAPYSYVFDGETGYLDHALATPSLDEQMAGVTEWHTNADEPVVLDYNLDGKTAAAGALYSNDAFRSSDHDPVVVALDLAPTFVDVTGNLSVVRNGPPGTHYSGQAGGAIHLTNISGRMMTGPFHAVFYGVPAGVTLVGATGSVDGNPYITISELQMRSGEKFTFPVKFTNPGKVAIAYTIKVFTGTF